MKVAFVGTSRIGEKQIAGWMKNKDRAEIVAIQSSTRERAEEFAKRYDIPHAYTDYEAMLDEQKPDLVDIANLPQHHVPMTLAAAERGIHVICQKPVALTWEDSVRMLEVCERNGIKFMANENFRWFPWYREVKRLIEKGRIGTPLEAASVGRHPGALKVNPDGHVSPWMERGYSITPKFMILEAVIHQIDILRFFFGEAKTVYAQLRRISPAVGGEDTLLMILGFEPAMALLDHTWATYGPSGGFLRIDGTKGTIIVGHDRRIRLYEELEGKPTYISDRWVFGESRWVYYPDVFAGMQRDFMDWILGGPEPETSGRRNLETMRICFAAYESSDRGEVIHLAQWGK